MLPLLLTLALLQPPPPTLYARSVQTLLARTPLAPHTEYLVLDLRTHETLASTFPPDPISPGSLLKPFLAFAAPPPYPTHLCLGHPDRCWRVHGTLTLPQALAQSCNSYFLALARTLTPTDFARLTPLALPPPPDSSPETLIGLTPAWRIPPATLALAYANLLAANPNSQILAGLRASARQGTASALGPHPGGALAKTGTAPCTDPHCLATGDGLTLALVPADHPTLLLLVRRRGTTGAVTARTAGHILTALESLHAP